MAFVPTGNGLVPAGSAVVPTGKNIESNSLVVRGKVEAWGGVFLPFDIVPDDPDLIVQAVKKACACANIVVLNAGSSKGSDDWSVEQLEEIGTIICHQVNHGPAHHSSAAVVDGTPVWASPTRRSAPRSHWGSTCCLL
ncbi:molybdopterin-binding protein [Slackia isoflavoniconvertens]|uniref:molybdopterin-binding protein n=1 Tax=Slackia isoflavoniconvertens TaxID=572010 RepID=UPI0015F08B9A|nr:molybdopterin-binding protein [Slackia isoflavoniconvertens]